MRNAKMELTKTAELMATLPVNDDQNDCARGWPPARLERTPPSGACAIRSICTNSSSSAPSIARVAGAAKFFALAGVQPSAMEDGELGGPQPGTAGLGAAPLNATEEVIGGGIVHVAADCTPLAGSVADSGILPSAKRPRSEAPLGDSEDSPADVIERAQKEGMWKQLQEYKAHASAAQTRVDAAESAVHGLRETLAAQAALLRGISAAVSAENFLPEDPAATGAALLSALRSQAASDAFIEAVGSASEIRGRFEALEARLNDTNAAFEAVQDACDAAQRRANRLELQLDRATKAATGALTPQADVAEAPTADALASQSEALHTGAAEAEAARELAARRLVDLERAEAVRVSLLVENESLKARLRRIPDEFFGHAGVVQNMRALQADVTRHQNDAGRWKRAAEDAAAAKAAAEAAADLRLAEANAAVGNRSVELKQLVDTLEAEALRMRRERDSMREAYERANAQVASAVRVNGEMQAAVLAAQQEITGLRAYSGRVEAIDAALAKLGTGKDSSGVLAALRELRDQESAMYAEIEAMATTLGDAQTRNDALVRQLAEKDEASGRALSDKLRADFALVQARKEGELAAHKAASLERVSLERMAAADNHERDARTAVADAEVRLRERGAELERAQWRVAELTAELAETRARNETLAHAVSAHESTLADKVRALEAAVFERARLREEVDALQRRVRACAEHHQAGVSGRSGEDTEVDIYRRLLKCNSCHTREKNAVITRCMHVFCRQCLDTRIETRQRKCPNCGEPFGAGDIRNIYL